MVRSIILFESDEILDQNKLDLLNNYLETDESNKNISKFLSNHSINNENYSLFKIGRTEKIDNPNYIK
ncbi:MAG: hypothetical protein PHN56_01780, partial [Candidatus Nanoarchaeia archaeon]|nr:hypothetical protein [Candidatus Nanoarchaeia archaeon]